MQHTTWCVLNLRACIEFQIGELYMIMNLLCVWISCKYPWGELPCAGFIVDTQAIMAYCAVA